MTARSFAPVTYLRVSTDRQGANGLGIAAQRDAIRSQLGNVEPLAEYVEVESGRRADRPELRKALDHARRSGAVLIIAKLDRLTRSARFLLELVDSGVALVFCDMPQVSGASGRFLLGILAQTAELEAAMIGHRTKAALRAAKARGVRLGNPNGAKALVAHVRAHGNAVAMAGKAAAQARAEPWRAVLQDMLDRGLSYGGIARELAAKGEKTVRGGRWNSKAVSRMVERLELVPATA